MEMTRTGTAVEQKSQTLPLQTTSSVDPQASSQQATSGKKKSGGFFSMKRK